MRVEDIEYEVDERLRFHPKDPVAYGRLIENLKNELVSYQGNEWVRAAGQLASHLLIAGQLDEAESLLRKALQMIDDLKLDSKLKIQQNLRLAHVLQFKREFDQSDALFLDSIVACEGVPELETYLAFALQHSAKNDFDQGLYKEALRKFDRALMIRLSQGVSIDQIESTKIAIERTTELLKEKKALKEMYDGMAKDYDEKVEQTQYIGPQWFCENLTSFAKTRAKSALDLGCGNGINADSLKKENRKVKLIGVDLSKKMVEQAEKKNVYSKVHCHSLDQRIGFINDASQDVIIALGCLEFVKNIDLCMDEVFRVLAPAGEVYLSFQKYVDGEFTAPRSTKSGSVLHQAYSEDEIFDFIYGRGLEILQIESCIAYVGGFPCPYYFLIAKKGV